MTPEQFMANFGAIAEAPEGILRLRELALSLAFRGRLTAGTVGSGREVLDAAAGEINQRTKDGQVRKRKSVVRPDDPTPFEIPVHWSWTRGEQVFWFITSGSRGWAKYYADEGPIFLRIGNLDYMTTELDLASIQRVRPPEGKETERTRVQAGDILVSITGDPGMIGVVPSSLGPAHMSQHVALARPCEAFAADFLGLYLTSPVAREQFFGAQRGIKNSLGLDDIRKLHVPAPPLAEQKRIVAKVDQLMAMLDDLEQRQEKKRTIAIHVCKTSLDSLANAEDRDQLARAWERVSKNFGVVAAADEGIPELRHRLLVLGIKGKLGTRRSSDEPIQHLVDRSDVPLPVSGRKSRAGKEASNATIPGDAGLSVGNPGAVAPPGWKWLPMHAIACLESGHTPSRRYPEYWDGDIPWIGIKDAREHHGGRIETTFQHATQAGLDNSAARLLPAGTVCLSRTASVGYVIEMARPMATSQDFVNWVCSEAVHPPFLVKLFLAESRALRRFSKGAVHQTIYFPEVKAFHVCLPPLAEQKRIVTKLNHLMSLLDDLEAKSTDLKLSATRLAATGTSLGA